MYQLQPHVPWPTRRKTDKKALHSNQRVPRLQFFRAHCRTARFFPKETRSRNWRQSGYPRQRLGQRGPSSSRAVCRRSGRRYACPHHGRESGKPGQSHDNRPKAAGARRRRAKRVQTGPAEAARPDEWNPPRRVPSGAARAPRQRPKHHVHQTGCGVLYLWRWISPNTRLSHEAAGRRAA